MLFLYYIPSTFVCPCCGTFVSISLPLSLSIRSPRLTPRTTPRNGASPPNQDDSEGGKGLAEIIKGLPDKRVVTSSGDIVDVKVSRKMIRRTKQKKDRRRDCVNARAKRGVANMYSLNVKTSQLSIGASSCAALVTSSLFLLLILLFALNCSRHFLQGDLKRRLAASSSTKEANQQQARASAAAAEKREAIASAAAARAQQVDDGNQFHADLAEEDGRRYMSNNVGTSTVKKEEETEKDMKFVPSSAAVIPPSAALNDPLDNDINASNTTLRVRVGSGARLEFTLPSSSTLRELYGQVAHSADLAVEAFELRG